MLRLEESKGMMERNEVRRRKKEKGSQRENIYCFVDA